MIFLGKTDAPPWGYCSCGWPLFLDGSCSNGECPDQLCDDDDSSCDDDDD